jgi:hypothetical protein
MFLICCGSNSFYIPKYFEIQVNIILVFKKKKICSLQLYSAEAMTIKSTGCMDFFPILRVVKFS